MGGSFLLDLACKSVFKINTNIFLYFLFFSYICSAKSYWCSSAFKRSFEDYRDAKENACCACRNILSIPGLTRKSCIAAGFSCSFISTLFCLQIFYGLLYLCEITQQRCCAWCLQVHCRILNVNPNFEQVLKASSAETYWHQLQGVSLSALILCRRFLQKGWNRL